MEERVNTVSEDNIELSVAPTTPTAGSFDADNDDKKSPITHIRCRNGKQIERSVYNAIHAGILALFEDREEITPHEFFGTLHDQFANIVSENVGWYIFQVKLEMEAKGLLKMKRALGKKNALAVITAPRKNKTQNKFREAAPIFAIGQAKKMYEMKNSFQQSESIDSFPTQEADTLTSPKVDFITRKSNTSAGITMPLDLYDAIKREMHLVLEGEEDGISLAAFYELLCSRFAKQLGPDTGWYLYHVKRDLETRGLIKIEHLKKNGQVWPSVKVFGKKCKKQSIL